MALVLQCLVEPHSDAVGLSVIGFGLLSVDFLHRQVELEGVVFRLPAALAPWLKEHPTERRTLDERKGRWPKLRNPLA